MCRKHEKELRKFEKITRKNEKEAAKKLEKEAAKIEKLNQKISRSTERVAPRSGSLERRQSGEEERTVLSQFTVHGIASPSKRPTLFDVFRPRTKSDATKKKEKDALLKVPGAVSAAESSSSGSSGGGSGGIMHSMKTAIQQTVGTHHSSKPVSKVVKDGSAHPHAGSDAQVL